MANRDISGNDSGLEDSKNHTKTKSQTDRSEEHHGDRKVQENTVPPHTDEKPRDGQGQVSHSTEPGLTDTSEYPISKYESFEGQRFQNHDFEKSSFSKCNFEGCTFKDCIQSGCNMINCKVNDSHLTGCNAIECIIDHCKQFGCNSLNSDITNCEAVNSDQFKMVDGAIRKV